MLTVDTAADSLALVTVEEAKAELRIAADDDSQNDRLAALIQDASAIITGWCNRDTFISEELTQTERLTEAEECLILARELNVEITAITEDGTGLADADWERDGALLYRLDSNDRRVRWSACKVEIEYTAGFTAGADVPRILRRAALDALTALYGSQGRDVTIRSEQTEGVGEVQYFDGRRADIPPIPADRLAALERYRRMAVA